MQRVGVRLAIRGLDENRWNRCVPRNLSASEYAAWAVRVGIWSFQLKGLTLGAHLITMTGAAVCASVIRKE